MGINRWKNETRRVNSLIIILNVTIFHLKIIKDIIQKVQKL